MPRSGRGGRRKGAGRPKKEVEKEQIRVALKSLPDLDNLTPLALERLQQVLRDDCYKATDVLRAVKLILERTCPVNIYEETLKNKGEEHDTAPKFFPVEGDPGDKNI